MTLVLVQNFVSNYVELDRQYVHTELLCDDIMHLLKTWFDDNKVMLLSMEMDDVYKGDVMHYALADIVVTEKIMNIVIGGDWHHSSGTWCDEHVGYVNEAASEIVYTYYEDWKR